MALQNINVQFGEILRKVREGRRMSQEQFADYCGISRAYYGRLERGEHSITLDTCQKIAVANGIALADLFSELP